jgi:hypothetical protein
MGEIAASGFEDFAEIFHAAAELALEAVTNDIALFIDAGLAGDEDEIADNDARTEG